ncbi:related to HXT1 - Low-affinity hexose facilitator [Melanopsichium pennsylvanicum]|uniref:Related to HXT1 - Low-affinity hexose facilitator n=2 Tax=Melanopsichium pennsylvanicum TaxID=63383 RepID=A0AAJ4XK30_9BASI|nr:related to HXT1-Low-affinity hexose facilitator [Melanopsichium pennsylvanicum 4]SNX83427.1 related to HXT1 - Low-affinity hexose facilitator [Melanopsichium pennsylvanicum]
MVAATPSSSPNGVTVGETKLLSKANVRPILFCSLAVIGAILYGYDGTYFTGILEMDRFKRDFGTFDSVNNEYYIPSNDQSLYASIVQAGEVVGSLIAAPLGDYVGRRGGFFGACTLVTLGVILQLVTIGSKALLTLGRGVLGAGVGIISNCTPLYLSEIAPTAIRGAIVSSWQLMLAIGQVIGACIAQGTKNLDSTWSYRVPIIFNLFFVAVLIAAQFIIPESPRWLIQKNRDDEALAALKRVNKGQHDEIRDQVIALEYNSFRQARQDELELSGEGGWKTLFHGVELRKFACVLGILIGQQIGGVQFIFSYTVTFMTAVGLNDAFTITIIVDVIEVVGVLCSFLLVNRFGRRVLILTTSIPMFIALFVVAGIGTKGLPPRGESLPWPGVISVTEGRTIAAMICIYVFFFNLAWGPLAWVVASELAVGKNRSKIMSIGTACFWVVAWAVTFTLPYLFYNANLGAQIGWIYGVGTLIAMTFVYFFIPETFGRSLEEINEMLEAEVPTRNWTTYVTRQERMLVDQSMQQDASKISTGPNDLSPVASNGDDKKGGVGGSNDKNPTRLGTDDVEA